MTYTTDTGINDTKFDPYILNIKTIIVLLQYASLFSTLLHNYSLSFQAWTYHLLSQIYPSGIKLCNLTNYITYKTDV